MTVSFSQIPNAWRVPLAAAEIETGARASAGGSYPFKALIIGQRLSNGTVAEAVVKQISSDQQGINFFGAASMIAQQIAAYRAVDPITELHAISLDDHGSAVSATKTITVTGTATAAGTVVLYVGGRRVTVAVASGDANTDVAAAIEAALDAASDLPFTAGVASNVVTLTARNGGVVAQDIDVRLNWATDEELPAGVAIAIANAVTGATNPDVTTALDALGDERYDVIVHPYTDATNLSALETYLNENWDAMTANDPVAITAENDTVSNLGTLGNTRNSGYSGIFQATDILEPAYQVAAAVGGQLAYQGNLDPGRPFNTLLLTGLKAPSTSQRPTKAEQNTLLYDGICPYYVDDGGNVRITELITTYKTNALGASDESLLYFNDVLLHKYLRRDFVTVVQLKYPRYKLAQNGTRIAPGSKVVTPALFKAECVAIYRAWEQLGYVQDVEYFIKNIIVEINSGNAGRLDVVLPITTIKGLRYVAAVMQF